MLKGPVIGSFYIYKTEAGRYNTRCGTAHLSLVGEQETWAAERKKERERE